MSTLQIHTNVKKKLASLKSARKQTKYFAKYLSILAVAIFFALSVYALWSGKWSMLFVVSQAIVISFIPYFLKWQYDIYTPSVFRVGIIIFLFLTIVLGEIASFYKSFWWWDIGLHIVATAGITVVAFSFIVLFFEYHTLQVVPLLTTVLAVSVAIFFGVLWEIYEFAVDMLLEPDEYLQPGNTDTMTDLIYGLIGAVLVGLFGYRYIRFDGGGAVGKLIHETVSKNKNHASGIQASYKLETTNEMAVKGK